MRSAPQPRLSLPDRIARRLLAAPERARLEALGFRDAGHGYDVFGMQPAWVRAALALARPAYRGYFRVRSEGAANIPPAGGAILAVNHSGELPFDAAMLWCDVLWHTAPPRLARPVADLFVPALPFIGTLFARCGVVQGSRGNVHHLLDAGELVMIFPEGAAGIGKPARDGHALATWHVGHAELAIQHGVPVVPVAVVGPAEQYPVALHVPLRPFGAPYLPVLLPPLPLPVRYHIAYGPPIDLGRTFTPGDARDAAAVALAATQVRGAVERLLADTLRRREGVFR